jgi:hypothetical protein
MGNEQMRHYHSRSSPRKHTSYDPFSVRCSRCRAAIGRPCVSARHKSLHRPHIERVECAAAEHRSQFRLRILDQLRRHPFARAFSECRMAVEGFSTRKLPAQEFEGRHRLGERGIAAQGDFYAA